MSEQLDLTTPETFPAPPAINGWKINREDLCRSPARATFYLIGTNGEERTYTFTGAQATTYINALNKRNATVKSNEKWTIEQLQSVIPALAGTVSGTPD